MAARSEKLSISIPAPSLKFMGAYRRSHDLESRSEAIEQAIALLRERQLEGAYRESARESDAACDVTFSDGLPDGACEIYCADLSPTVGPGINERRPVVIVGNNASNRAALPVTVLPIASNVARVIPFEVPLPSGKSGLPKDSKAMAQQIRTISRECLLPGTAGVLDVAPTKSGDAANRLHLGSGGL